MDQFGKPTIEHDRIEPKKVLVEETEMTESTTKNFFETPSNGNTAWGAAGGALVGALVGEGGLLGGNKNAVTPDQLGTAINGLQGNLQRDQLQEQIGNSTAALGLDIGSVKDAITSAASSNALGLCGLGNSIAQGFAATNFNIQDQASKGRELALQQALDAERSRATELRIQLSEAHNNAQHATTQVLVQQLVAKA